MGLLIEKEFTVHGSWYSPTEKLLEFASVVEASHLDTTSSSGDWSGYFVQVIGKTAYLIDFSQSNNWPDSGYTLYTGDVQTSWKVNRKTFDEDVKDAVKTFLAKSF